MNKCCKCELCATVHIVNIGTDGCFRETFLCQNHANECNVLAENGYDIIDELPSNICDIVLSNNICPYCGCTKEFVEKNNICGCAKCYKIFDFVKIYGYKNQNVYLGKIPSKIFFKKNFEPRMLFFKKKLDCFIKSECFEAAGLCKKQIELIENEIKKCKI